MDFILPLAIMSTAFLSLSRKVLKKYSASLRPSNYLSPNFNYLNDPIPPRLGIIGSFLSIFGNSIFGKFIAIGITWSFSFHILSEIRHLIMDLGYGFEIKTSNLTGMIVIIFSFILTILIYLLGRQLI